MKYITPLLVVKDMETSVKFYKDILDLQVIEDFGANKVLTGGISLQTLESWTGFIDKTNDDIKFSHNSSEIYFEEDNIDLFFQKLIKLNVKLVHPLIEHSWGQRAVRFYDPDFHIIEVGEKMQYVFKRFLDEGLSVEQVAVRMDVSIEYVKSQMGIE